MTTVLDCSKCSQSVEVTARVLHFPFVCDGCSVLDSGESEENSEGGDNMFIEREFEEPSLDHDDATIENTNTLFENLEEELAQAKADREALVADVVSLGDQLEAAADLNEAILKGAIRFAIATGQELTKSHEFEAKSATALANAMKQIDGLQLEVKLKGRELSVAQRELSDVRQMLRGARSSEWHEKYKAERYYHNSRHYQNQLNDARSELRSIRRELRWYKRSFWKKLGDILTFNWKYFDPIDPQPAR